MHKYVFYYDTLKIIFEYIIIFLIIFNYLSIIFSSLMIFENNILYFKLYHKNSLNLDLIQPSGFVF